MYEEEKFLIILFFKKFIYIMLYIYMYTCFTCICLIHIMGYREVFMSGIFLDNKGCDFFFINFQFYKNSKLVGGWWVGFFFLPQTLWAFLILILVYYCPYFSLYVGRDPLSCQSVLSGAGSPLLWPPGEMLWSISPFSHLPYSPFPLIQAYPILNNQKMILRLFFCLYIQFSLQTLSPLSLTNF